MRRRPLSITIIAWTLIVIGLNIAFLTLLVMPTTPGLKEYTLANLPPELFYILAFASAGISLFSGMFMLGGANWTRYMCLAYGAVFLAWSFVALPGNGLLIPEMGVFAIILFFLFKPGARDFFAPRGMTATQDHGIF
ncbi:hypothetical protein [Desulfatibacillum aliphaticivorans]|uniref:hypothetical protein n=1 Tax=Desulfatibacillum aliphaticivorans TaxID=218208 RepID=UPI00040435AF|nr:hypothetical protein [Desulfatibacillum aliphaticivorans]